MNEAVSYLVHNYGLLHTDCCKDNAPFYFTQHQVYKVKHSEILSEVQCISDNNFCKDMMTE